MDDPLRLGRGNAGNISASLVSVKDLAWYRKVISIAPIVIVMIVMIVMNFHVMNFHRTK